MRIPVAQSTLLALAASLAACAPSSEPKGAATLPVAVTIPPHAWLVGEVGGDHVAVVTVVRPGESPTSYQPSDAEVSRVMTSRLYFRSGVPVERSRWFQALVLEDTVRIVDLRSQARAAEDQEDDPHSWLSPASLRRQARGVAVALAEADPEHRSDFEENLARLEARLTSLEAALRARLAPFAGRAFFVFHPSWGHFAEAFDLRQVAIEIDGKEPTDWELSRLQALAREEAVQVVFIQPQFDRRSAAAVAGAVGARLEMADPLAFRVDENLERFTERLVESFR